jgi:hypothetical protein
MTSCVRDGCPNPVTRSNQLYCSQGCRTAAWRARHGLILQTRPNPLLRRKSRDGVGIRPYLTPTEADELIAGRVPASVVAKLEAKLKPPEPLPGQLNIIDALEGTTPHACHSLNGTTDPQAPATQVRPDGMGSSLGAA